MNRELTGNLLYLCTDCRLALAVLIQILSQRVMNTGGLGGRWATGSAKREETYGGRGAEGVWPCAARGAANGRFVRYKAALYLSILIARRRRANFFGTVFALKDREWDLLGPVLDLPVNE